MSLENMGYNGIKRRIYDQVIVKGKPLFTLFDSGAQDSYITREAAKKLNLKPQRIAHSYGVGLGGKKRIIKEFVPLDGILHGFTFIIFPLVVDDLGKTRNGETIELLFGILAMEKWGVELDIKGKKVDTRHFAKDFTEFPV